MFTKLTLGTSARACALATRVHVAELQARSSCVWPYISLRPISFFLFMQCHESSRTLVDFLGFVLTLLHPPPVGVIRTGPGRGVRAWNAIISSTPPGRIPSYTPPFSGRGMPGLGPVLWPSPQWVLPCQRATGGWSRGLGGSA